MCAIQLLEVGSVMQIVSESHLECLSDRLHTTILPCATHLAATFLNSEYTKRCVVACH